MKRCHLANLPNIGQPRLGLVRMHLLWIRLSVKTAAMTCGAGLSGLRRRQNVLNKNEHLEKGRFAEQCKINRKRWRKRNQVYEVVWTSRDVLWTSR